MKPIVQGEIWKVFDTSLIVTEGIFCLFFFLEGNARIKLDCAKIEEVQAGQLLIVNQNCVCQCHSDAGCLVEIIQVDAQRAAKFYPEIRDMIFKAETLRSTQRKMDFNFGRDQIFLSNCLNLLKEENQTELGTQADFILSLLCLEYTVFNDRLEEYSYVSYEKKERILAVLHQLYNDPKERITLKQAAAAVGLTPQHLSTLWKEIFGLSFLDYAMKVRLGFAEAMLLKSDKNITEIIQQSGFSEPKAFYRSFQKEFHCSPSAWKKRWEKTTAKQSRIALAEAEALLADFRRQHQLFEKPMDSAMYQKYCQLKEMDKAGIPLKALTVSIDLGETLDLDQTQVQPLVMFGYDLLMRFIMQHKIGLRVVFPLAKMKRIEAKECNAVTLMTYVVETMRRFGRFYLSHLQVDLVFENQTELTEITAISKELHEMGINSVNLLF